MIGSGHRSNASIGSFVELNLGADRAVCQCQFDDAGFSEKSWSLNMSGSREMTGEFSKCVVTLGQAAPTQPSSKGTQPFGSQAMARHSPTIRATMTAASEGMIR